MSMPCAARACKAGKVGHWVRPRIFHCGLRRKTFATDPLSDLLLGGGLNFEV